MKLLGYLFCALAVVVAAMLLFDSFLTGINIETVWWVLDYLMCLALLICVLLSLRDQIRAGLTSLKASLLLRLLTFLVMAETFIQHEMGTPIPAMQWIWVDALVVLVLLQAGVEYLVSGSDAPKATAE